MSDEKPPAEPAGTPASPAPEKSEASAAPSEKTTDGEGGGEPTEPSAAEAAEPAGESSGEPSGKRKKRKRKKSAEEVVLRPSLRPDGRERPAFLLAFPSDAELEPLIRAFELGNYALVRKGAPELAERTPDAKVRAAAEELARRIEPDPLVKVLLGLSIALLVVLTLWAYKTHGG